MQETPVLPLGWEEPLEKGKATHSSILAWRIPWTAEHQAPLSFIIFWSLLKFMSIESVMLSDYLILRRPPPTFDFNIFPSIRVFFNELALCIRLFGASASASVLLMNI